VEGGRRDVKTDPVSYAQDMEKRGAGELLLNAIDRDGTMEGYDLELIRRVSEAVSVPVVAVGGAGSLKHFREAVEYGASAAAAGSMFVFHGKHKAVLITYPRYDDIKKLFE
jgi:cyclase